MRIPFKWPDTPNPPWPRIWKSWWPQMIHKWRFKSSHTTGAWAGPSGGLAFKSFQHKDFLSRNSQKLRNSSWFCSVHLNTELSTLCSHITRAATKKSTFLWDKKSSYIQNRRRQTKSMGSTGMGRWEFVSFQVISSTVLDHFKYSERLLKATKQKLLKDF